MRKILYGLFIIFVLVATLLLLVGCKKKDTGTKNEIDTSKILIGAELLNSVVEGELDEEGTYTQVTIPESLPEEESNNTETPNVQDIAWEVETVSGGENGEEITQTKVNIDGIDYVQNELKRNNSRALVQIGKTDYTSIENLVNSKFFENHGAKKDSSTTIEHGGVECTEFSVDIDDNTVKNKKGYWGAFERENVIFVYYYYVQNGIDNSKLEDFFSDVIMHISIY